MSDRTAAIEQRIAGREEQFQQAPHRVAEVMHKAHNDDVKALSHHTLKLAIGLGADVF